MANLHAFFYYSWAMAVSRISQPTLSMAFFIQKEKKRKEKAMSMALFAAAIWKGFQRMEIKKFLCSPWEAGHLNMDYRWWHELARISRFSSFAFYHVNSWFRFLHEMGSGRCLKGSPFTYKKYLDSGSWVLKLLCKREIRPSLSIRQGNVMLAELVRSWSTF